MTLEKPATGKSRDAERTRQLLLGSARRRFAYDGYSGTTVRDIATDAGVNVALINRYFGSKEGLFAACLTRAVKEFDQQDDRKLTIETMVESLVARVADLPSGEHPLELLLLIRSSGDEKADQIRTDTLSAYSQRMAEIAGWKKDDPATEDLILRAQITIATAFGIVMLRASSGLEPLSSASRVELLEPLGEVVTALLGKKDV